MSWHPPLWKYTDDAGTAWHIHKRGPIKNPENTCLRS